ncbi:MAG: SCP2 sterol-binding domain-containing protein [Acidimicrobiales bacterium]
MEELLMEAFAFLSDEWIEMARELQAEFAGSAEPPALEIRMNLVVTAVPFDDSPKQAHLDTSSGELVLDLGHVEDPDLTVTLDYDTAKAILVDQNQQAGMQAFMAGRIKIEGDMSRLLALQATPADPLHAEIARRVREFTA